MRLSWFLTPLGFVSVSVQACYPLLPDRPVRQPTAKSLEAAQGVGELIFTG
jgi:hypothetical protein